MSKNYFVVGIHKGADKNSDYNIGTFIHVIVDKIKNSNDINNNTPIIPKYETDINTNKIINVNNKEQNEKYNKDKNINKNKNNNKNNNEVILIYKKVFGNFILFGSPFIDRNKDKCKIIINGKETKLCEYFKDNKDTLEVKFIQTKQLTELSYMFSGSFLIEVKNILYLSSKYITNMNAMFQRCQYLTNLPEEFSDFDTSNVTNMDSMFSQCANIRELPNISK